MLHTALLRALREDLLVPPPEVPGEGEGIGIDIEGLGGVGAFEISLDIVGNEAVPSGGTASESLANTAIRNFLTDQSNWHNLTEIDLESYAFTLDQWNSGDIDFTATLVIDSVDYSDSILWLAYEVVPDGMGGVSPPVLSQQKEGAAVAMSLDFDQEFLVVGFNSNNNFYYRAFDLDIIS